MNSSDLNRMCMRCDICEVSMIGLVTFNAHLAGRQHKNRAELVNNKVAMALNTTAEFQMSSKDPYFCKVCKIATTGPAPYQQHLQSAKHLKKAEISGHCEPPAPKKISIAQPIILAESTPNVTLNVATHNMSTPSNDPSSKYLIEHLKNVTVIERHEKIADVLAEIGYIIPK